MIHPHPLHISWICIDVVPILKSSFKFLDRSAEKVTGLAGLNGQTLVVRKPVAVPTVLVEPVAVPTVLVEPVAVPTVLVKPVAVPTVLVEPVAVPTVTTSASKISTAPK